MKMFPVISGHGGSEMELSNQNQNQMTHDSGKEMETRKHDSESMSSLHKSLSDIIRLIGN